MGTPRISHVYSYCHDLDAMRAFYAGLLGLPVTVHNADFIEFNAGVKLVFLLSKSIAPREANFSSIPGWEGGAAEAALCSIQCSQLQLEAIRARLDDAVAKFTEPELRDGALELRAVDPMGNTVELYAIAT